MQSSEVLNASETLEMVTAKELPLDVSEKNESYVSEDQLSFEWMPASAMTQQDPLKSCDPIETVNITSPRVESPSNDIKADFQKDFKRALKSLTEVISQDVESQKELILTLNPSRKLTITHELNTIITELNDFKPHLLPETLDSLLYASPDSLEGRGLQVFCSRVTHFMIIRLILIHYWKTLGLIEYAQGPSFSDPNLAINHILNKSCVNLIKDKHNWLFAKQNNYSWYKISPRALEDINTILSFWEFTQDSIVVLSILYERYLDENRLRKYSHYTPPLLVRFIWDFLKDHLSSPSLFRILGKNRVPKLIFDPTMGSGNFLVEAARLQEEELKQDEHDTLKRLKETTLAYTTGLYGCDIDAFAHFFSEIKLLWKLSSLMKESQSLEILPHQRIHPSLSIIHQNALKLYNKEQLEMITSSKENPGNAEPGDPHNSAPPQVADSYGADPRVGDPELSVDTKFGLLPLEGHLKYVHSKIRLLEKFDFCVGCPPEQILHEQKKFMKELIEKIPYWKKHYQSNLLYSSWFFVLGLSKLREGGKLIYLTETYWPTEEGAEKLRKYLLSESKILCIIDLGTVKIEEDTTPLPRYITLLEKCSSKEGRDNHKIKMITVHPQKDPATAAFILGKILSKAKTIDRPGKIYSDSEVDIYYSGVEQGELGEQPWQQIYDTGFSQILKQILSYKTTLNYFCSIEENKEPEENKTALITSELGMKNKFSIYTEKPESGNFIALNPTPISKESPYYLMALLNSPILNFWYANNGNKKNGRKLYVPSALKMIPIRPIDFGKPMEDSLRTEKLAQIESALQKFDEKYLMANLNLELTHGREEVVHDAIILMQKEILEIEKILKRYDSFFKENFSDLANFNLCPIYNPLTFRNIYPPEKQCLLKEHPKVFVHKENALNDEQFCLTHFKRQVGIKNEGEHLMLISKDNSVIKLYAPRELLDFIENDLTSHMYNYWDEVGAAIGLPKDLEEFNGFKEDIVSHCLTLKEKQLKIIKIIHGLIYKLYGFNMDDKDPEKSKFAQNAIQIMDASA